MKRIAVLVVVSDHFRSFRSSSSKQTENVSSFWSSSRMGLMFETRFLPLLHLCEVSENCFIRLGHDWNHFNEKADHFQRLRADKLSTFFKSEAFTFPSDSAGFVEFIWTWTRNIERHWKVFTPLLLIAFDWQIFFFLVFSVAAFLSFTFCCSDSQ